MRDDVPAAVAAAPLQLLLLACSFALAGYAGVRLLADDWFGVALWFVGAARAARPGAAAAVRDGGPGARPGGCGAGRAAADVEPLYVRVPAALSGLLLLVWFPLISGRVADRYESATGLSGERLPRPLAADHRRAVRRLGAPAAVACGCAGRRRSGRPPSTDRRRASRAGGVPQQRRGAEPGPGERGAGAAVGLGAARRGGPRRARRRPRRPSRRSAGRRGRGVRPAGAAGRPGSPPMPMLPSRSRAVPQRPSPGSGSKTERLQRLAAEPHGAGDGGLADVDAERGPAPGGERGDQPSGSAADVEHGALAAAQDLQVRRVGARAPALHLQGQQPAVRAAQEERAPAGAQGVGVRVVDQAADGLRRVAVATRRPSVRRTVARPVAVGSRRSPSAARRSSGADRRSRASSAANRLRGATAATASASAAVSTSRRRGRSRTRSPAATSRSRCTAPVAGVDIGTPRSSAGSGSARPSAQKPPSSAGPNQASQLGEVHRCSRSGRELRGVHADEQRRAVAAGEGGGEPLVQAARALRYDVEAGRQPGAGRPVEHEDAAPGGRRGHGAQGVGEGGLGERRRLPGREGRGEPGLDPARHGLLGDDEQGGHRGRPGVIVRSRRGAAVAGVVRAVRPGRGCMSRTACQVPRQVPVTFERRCAAGTARRAR